MLSLKPISYCFLNCHFTTTTTTTTTTILLSSSSSSSSSSLFNKFHHQIPRNGSSQLPISSTIRKRRRRRRPRFSTSPTTTTTTLVVVSSNNNNKDNSSSNNSNRISDSPESEKQKAMEIQSLPTTITPLDCFGTGLDVECLVPPQFQDTDETDRLFTSGSTNDDDDNNNAPSLSLSLLLDWSLLISPFFFWGTAMVAMKEVLPKAGPFFVSTFRLIPAGLLLVSFASSTGRKQPSGTMAWLSISLFALIDATCFQGFLAQGLQRTSAGLGSVIIDSQPLTVAVLATLLFGESIGVVGVAGLVLGVVGLLLLEVPVISFDGNDFSLWGSGEWWMLLAAQSMAVGTVMVRWVSKYSDPVMATGWHMVIGGVPLVVISVLNHDPAISGSLKELTSTDLLALLYTSVFGSAISYGVYFYNATRGSLTKLSSLTFLTPMFASVFGFLYLGETFSPVQLVGALVTVVSIYLVNYRSSSE